MRLNSIYLIPCIILVFVQCYVNGFKRGDICNDGKNVGKCKSLRNCNSALDLLVNGERVTFCSKSKRLVCCTDDTTGCQPITADLVAGQKNGQKAWDKCIDYAEYINICQTSPTPTRLKVRGNICKHDSKALIIGGQDAARDEFPHMAALGYYINYSNGTILWGCGGSLISERWILTSAHCTFHRQYGDVKVARLGAIDLSEKSPPEFLYNVSESILHPDYILPSHYNDIALVKLKRTVVISQSVIPICLHIGNQIRDAKLIASGYGDTDTKNNKLIKVTLDKFDDNECAQHYNITRKLPKGILADSQICAGGRTEMKNTCQGDSGGPIQILNNDVVHCTYLLVGVTSFGYKCTNSNIPGVYTTVAKYVPWIESIVWP